MDDENGGTKLTGHKETHKTLKLNMSDNTERWHINADVTAGPDDHLALAEGMGMTI